MNNKNKKAQMKIQEMSFMLLALILFFVIVGLFWLSFSGSSLKRDYEQLSMQKTISSMIRLADSPEFSCGERLCIDLDKVIALKESPDFKDFWEIDGLVIKRIYPNIEQEIECNSGSYINCNTITVKEPSSGSIALSSFVSLCRKESKSGYSYDKCEIGLILAYNKKLE